MEAVKTSRPGLTGLLPDDARTDQTIAAYELLQSVSARLRDLRRQAGLNQRQVAEAVGVSQGRISQIESGLLDHAPNLEMVARYAEACGYRANLAFSPSRAETTRSGKTSDLSSLTVREAAEPSGMLEEKWGVSAVATVSAPAQVSEDPTEFTIVLTAGGDDKINVIKQVRGARPDLGLKEARDLVEGAPRTIVENVSKQRAEQVKRRLERAGAAVQMDAAEAAEAERMSEGFHEEGR